MDQLNYNYLHNESEKSLKPMLSEKEWEKFLKDEASIKYFSELVLCQLIPELECVMLDEKKFSEKEKCYSGALLLVGLTRWKELNLDLSYPGLRSPKRGGYSRRCPSIPHIYKTELTHNTKSCIIF